MVFPISPTSEVLTCLDKQSSAYFPTSSNFNRSSSTPCFLSPLFRRFYQTHPREPRNCGGSSFFDTPLCFHAVRRCASLPLNGLKRSRRYRPWDSCCDTFFRIATRRKEMYEGRVKSLSILEGLRTCLNSQSTKLRKSTPGSLALLAPLECGRCPHCSKHLLAR